jgi:hypothetical protein
MAVCNGRIAYDRERTTAYGYDRQLTGEGWSGFGRGSGIPVSGEGHCFSVFLQTTRAFCGCRSRQVQVTLGYLANEGIEGFGRYVAE